MSPVSRLLPGTGLHPPGPRVRSAPALRLLLAALGLLALSGCVHLRQPRPPGRTTVATRTTVLPARILSNFFLVEARQADGRTRRFLLDTGSSVSLVSPGLAHALRLREKSGPARTVLVRSAQGGEVELETTTLKSLSLGDTSFERVPALIYDLTALSAHLGLTLDGVLGFPLFRDTLLTLDYPGGRLVLAPPPATAALPAPTPGAATIAFNNDQNSPLIPIRMGNESFVVLLDSGSDGGLSLNPVGLHPRFAHGPRPGPLVTSLSGDHRQLVGRLAQNVLVGTHTVEQPVTELTDQLSALGGDLLRHFELTFDQLHNRVTFRHPGPGPVRMAARRSSGLSFSRSPVYWRVLTVVPDTPAAGLPIQTGDLCVRINGEPVEQWDAARYHALLLSADRITYTFINGPNEVHLDVPVIALVP